MNKRPSFREIIRYRFENTLSKGTIALIVWLALLSGLVILVGATLFYFAGISFEAESSNALETVWRSFVLTMDPGGLGEGTGWFFRIIALLITIGGIFIMSALIGVLNSGLEGKIEDMRKGHSRVIERNHTLILGWSEKIFSIMEELAVANKNRKRAIIVVLADKNKVEMEDEIRSKIKNIGNMRIVCRSGSPLELNDLAIVSLNEARSIIMIAPEDRNSDIYTIKSVLAITNNPDRKKDKFHIVAEIKDEKNLEAARLVGNDEVSYILTSDLAARVTVQSTRQSGLSVVYTELLSFEGSEIYFKEERDLVGKSFREAMFAYSNSTLIGIEENSGKVVLNPSRDRIFEEGEKPVFIAEEKEAIVLSSNKELDINTDTIIEGKETVFPKEETLILGWNRKGNIIIRKLDNYLAIGSKVTVLSELDVAEEEIKKIENNVKNQNISFVKGDIIDRETLNNLNILSFEHIIILSYDHLGFREAEAKTLVCLLHLRNIGEKGGKHLNIVSEILSEKNKKLAEVSKADDYIVSEKLTSLVITQFSENRSIKAVFDDLFDAKGSEIYLEKVSNYIKIGSDVNFYTLTESAVQKNQIAIGYRIKEYANNPEKNYGVVLNPKKSEVISLKEEDRIIVISTK